MFASCLKTELHRPESLCCVCESWAKAAGSSVLPDVAQAGMPINKKDTSSRDFPPEAGTRDISSQSAATAGSTGQTLAGGSRRNAPTLEWSLAGALPGWLPP